MEVKMKKLIALSLIIIILCPILSACNIAANLTHFLYDNEELYTVGDGVINDKIDRVEIDWIRGDIKIEYHSLENIRFTESPDKDVDDDMIMRYRVEGSTLKIKFSASGEWNFNNIKKDLTLYLPSDLSLSELDINTTASVVTLRELNIEDLTMDTVSASVMLDNCNITSEIEIETVSGNIHIDAEAIPSLTIETVSGRMNITADTIEELDIETTSGSVLLDCSEGIEKMDISAVSGEVDLSLPENSAFTVRFDTVSGKLTSTLPFTQDGDAYHVNGGGNGYKIDTVSGDVTITKSK